MLIDKLVDTDVHAREWVDEVKQGLYINGDVPGREIELFSQNNKKFGAELKTEAKHLSYGFSRCVGKTTP